MQTVGVTTHFVYDARKKRETFLYSVTIMPHFHSPGSALLYFYSVKIVGYPLDTT